MLNRNLPPQAIFCLQPLRFRLKKNSLQQQSSENQKEQVVATLQEERKQQESILVETQEQPKTIVKDESLRESNNKELVKENNKENNTKEERGISVKKNKKEWEIGGNSVKRVAHNSKFSIGASSNITGRGKMSTANTNSMRAMVAELGYNEYISHSTSPQITPLSESSYSLPLNFALSFTYNVSERFYLGSGITYTYLHSKYDGIMDGTRFRIKQGIHFVGVPLNAYYSVLNGNRWNFYVNGGGTVEKGVRVIYNMKTITGQTRSTNSHVKGLQYSLNAGMGAEYKLGEQGMFGIYAEPRATYYFDSKIPKSIRTDQPFQFEVQFGVRLHLR